MDLSYWVNLSKDIKPNFTKKIYFGRYLWRLEYQIIGANLITDASIANIQNYIEFRRTNNQKSSYYSYTTYSRDTSRFQKMDAEILDKMRTIRKLYSDKIKMRVEGDLMQIFAETEDDLKMISEAIGLYAITSISYPKPGTEGALINGTIFMGKYTNYKYKVILRDGDYSLDTKKSLLAQFDANDQVQVPNQLRSMLTKKYTYIWSSYFYTNDTAIVTMISLIAPGIVGKIHPIEHLQ